MIYETFLEALLRFYIMALRNLPRLSVRIVESVQAKILPA